MREILRGYTLFVAGIDYGLEVEEITCPLPDMVYAEHMYGGAVMTSQVNMMKVAVMEPTVKFQSYNPDIVSMLVRGPNERDRFIFRAALFDELGGPAKPNLIIYEGQLTAPAPDQWSREDKSGIEYTIKNVIYYRQEIGSTLMHEIGAYPPKMTVRTRNLLQSTGFNDALGRAS